MNVQPVKERGVCDNQAFRVNMLTPSSAVSLVVLGSFQRSSQHVWE